jgi:hypothetical protein
MAKIELHPDFKDFLRLLTSCNVRYLLVGGYAVGYHGYPRATGDMDIWIEISESNSINVASAFRDFGVPPVRLEVITSASGVDFNDCYANREVVEIDGIPINLISLQDLKKNKRAAGRHKDMEDIEHLP